MREIAKTHTHSLYPSKGKESKDEVTTLKEIEEGKRKKKKIRRSQRKEEVQEVDGHKEKKRIEEREPTRLKGKKKYKKLTVTKKRRG